MQEDGIPSAPADWSVAPLNKFTERVTYGFTNPMPTTESGPYMVTAKDIRDGRIDFLRSRHTSMEAYETELTDKSRPRIGDVLLTKDGSIGRVAVCDRELVCINQSVALLRPNHLINSTFLAYLLQAPHYQERMDRDSGGSTIKHIYITRVDKMSIAVPPQSEQQGIAAVLGALDDKIVINERVVTAVSQLAREKFRLQSLAAVEEVRVGDMVDLKYGKSLPAIQRIAGDIPVFGSGGISGFHQSALTKGPGIIIGRKGTVGAVYWSQLDFFPIDTTFYVACKSSRVSLEYMYFALRSLGLEQMNSDSAVPGINRDRVHSLVFRLPEPNAMRDFTTEARGLFELQRSREQESSSLASLRDTLLPQLMSGRLRVKDAEKMVEDHV